MWSMSGRYDHVNDEWSTCGQSTTCIMVIMWSMNGRHVVSEWPLVTMLMTSNAALVSPLASRSSIESRAEASRAIAHTRTVADDWATRLSLVMKAKMSSINVQRRKVVLVDLANKTESVLDQLRK